MAVRSGSKSTNRINLQVALKDGAPVKSCKPSVDVLFRSVASLVNGNILAVIMTGMGDDGADGVQVLKRKGCLCFSQSEDTCVVYGMPRAVDEKGLSDKKVSLKDMAAQITKTVKS
jgi:two-component system chemotaxis response regulator CheB